MAKGDINAQPQAPKMDQYSVMHKIFDHLGSQQGNPLAPMGGRFNTGGPSMRGPVIGGFTPPNINLAPNPEATTTPIAPVNPQEMIRKSMMGMGRFGQMQ